MACGETNLQKILSTLKPIHRPGIYVFTTVSSEDRNKISNVDIQSEFKELEA